MPQSSRSSAIRSDGSLNVDFLQKEILKDVSRDMKYKREDDMKKRAVHMSKDYDEFRAFVTCSHLRPVQRKDMTHLFQVDATGTGTGMIRNATGDSSRRKARTGRSRKSTDRRSRQSPSPNEWQSPRNMMEFTRDWDRQCHCNYDRVLYLTRCSEGSLFFKSKDLDSTVMTQILDAVHALADSHTVTATNPVATTTNDPPPPIIGWNGAQRAEFVWEWLEAVTGCARFSLNVAFLSRDEKSRVRYLIREYLPAQLAGTEDCHDINTIADDVNNCAVRCYTPEVMARLEKMYDV